jgi:hypothetical protein
MQMEDTFQLDLSKLHGTPARKLTVDKVDLVCYVFKDQVDGAGDLTQEWLLAGPEVDRAFSVVIKNSELPTTICNLKVVPCSSGVSCRALCWVAVAWLLI